MLNYELITRLDSKSVDLYILKADITGQPSAQLYRNGSPVSGSTAAVFDEGTRWRLTFTSRDFVTISADYDIRVTDGNGASQDYCTVNMGQSACVNSGVTFDMVVKVDEGDVTVGGFFRGGPEPPSPNVNTSIDGNNFTLANKVGTNPDTYEQTYISPTTFTPRVLTNGCPSNKSIKSINLESCSVQITEVNTTNPAGPNNATLSVTASGTGLTGTLEYRLVGTGFDSGYQASNSFNGLEPGIYDIFVRDSGNINCSDTLNWFIPDELSAELDITNVSSNGASDGQIEVINLTGSDNYSFSWLHGPTTPIISNLLAGTYQVTITDNQTGQQITLEGVVNQPQLEPEPAEPFLEVPIMQSFHFVRDVTPDNCDVFQGLDNVLFCKQEHPYFTKANYYQKVLQCDTPPVQIRSSLDNFTIKLKNYFDNSEVATFTSELKVENVGRVEAYPVYLQNNGSGESRVYFSNSPQIPLLLEAGDTFEIKNNADGFNGNYQIISIQEEATTGNQYLVISANYGIAAPTTPATAEFTTNLVNFNIYEADISFGLIPFGVYYLEVRAEDVDQGFLEVYNSEPIQVVNDPKELNLVSWTNFDSAYEIDYTTGIRHQVRVESTFFKRLPGADREQLRNTNGSLTTLTAKPRRKIVFETFQLPPYLHEKLAIAFDHDSVRIQNIEVISEDGYEEPQYLIRYPLSNSRIVVEQRNYLNNTYNGDDLGGLNEETGFIETQEGFIKR